MEIFPSFGYKKIIYPRFVDVFVISTLRHKKLERCLFVTKYCLINLCFERYKVHSYNYRAAGRQ